MGKVCFFLLAWLPLFYLSVNLYAVRLGVKRGGELSSWEKEKEWDVILVLGAGVRDNGMPSPMLEDRLLTALALYEKGAAERILVSGDHGREEYDEVNVMKNYLIEKGVPSDRIFMDHAGFSTYDSMYRAKEIFGVKKLLIVTQKYHSHRAAMIGVNLGLECQSVYAPILSSQAKSYRGQLWYSVRESVARCKDWFNCVFRPEAKILGEKISLEAGGDVTNDKAPEKL